MRPSKSKNDKDNQEDLFQAVEHAFQDWTGDVAHEVITVADEESQIREFRIKAYGGNRTTLRIVSQENEQIVWVDVENENHNGDLSELERPRELVTSLIKTSENSGGTPKRGKSEFHMLLPQPYQPSYGGRFGHHTQCISSKSGDRRITRRTQ